LKTAEDRDFPMELVVMQRMLKKYSASGCQIMAAESITAQFDALAYQPQLAETAYSNPKRVTTDAPS